MRIAHLLCPHTPDLESRIAEIEAQIRILEAAGVDSRLLLAPPTRKRGLCPGSLPFPTWKKIVADPDVALLHFHGIESYAKRQALLSLAAGLNRILTLERGFARAESGVDLSIPRRPWLRPHRIVCQTKIDFAAATERYPHVPVDYIPRAVNLRALPRGEGLAFRHDQGIPQQNPLIVLAGPLGSDRDRSGILDSIEEALALHSCAVFAFLPLGTEVAHLKATLDARFPGQHRLRILDEGLQSEVARNGIAAADLVVVTGDCPDADEIIVDAWANLHPVLAARGGEGELLVRHGKDGLHYDPARPGDFLEGIQALFENPTLGSSLCRGGFTRLIGEFDESVVSARLRSVYAEAIETYETDGAGRWHWRQLAG